MKKKQYDSEALLEELRKDGYMTIAAREAAACIGLDYKQRLHESAGADARDARWSLLVSGDGGTIEEALMNLSFAKLCGPHCQLVADTGDSIHTFPLPIGKKKVSQKATRA